MLTRQLSQDLSSCLQPSNIPSYPFDRSAAAAVSEAIDGLWIYARLAYHYAQGTAWFQDLIVSLLSSTWKWIEFISPRSGTIADMDDEDEWWPDIYATALPCRLSSNGCLEVTPGSRAATMAIYILPLVAAHFPRAMKFLAAQPDFSDVVLSMLHHTLQPSIASVKGYHRYVMIVGYLLIPDDNRLYKRFREDFLRSDERHHPGRALRMILERMEWAYYGEYVTEAEESKQVDTYIRMFSTDDTLLGDDEMMTNLKAAGMPVSLARILRRATARTDMVKNHSHRRSILGIWFKTLDVLLNLHPAPSLSLSDVTAALRHGLLTALYLALCTAADTRDDEEAITNFRRNAANIAGRCLTTGLVWPKVLRAFDTAFYREQLDEATNGCNPPEWEALISRYQFYTRTRQTYNANLVKIFERCGNTECPFAELDTRLRICPCASVSYCSRACQKTDWRARHHQNCSIIINAPTIASADTITVAHIPDSVSLAERIYLKRCAAEYLMEYGDPEAMRDICSVLVDLINPQQPYPSVKYGELDSLPGIGEFDERYIHIYVRVRRSGYVILIEVEVKWRNWWVKAAGSRRRVAA